MKTKIIYIEDVKLIVPDSYHAPYKTLKEFPSCCGAGDGIGNGLVPETMYGLLISAACHVHDKSYEEAEPVWSDFHSSNYMFLVNLLSIIRAKSANFFMRRLRNRRAMRYFTEVDEIGAIIFKKIKKMV